MYPAPPPPHRLFMPRSSPSRSGMYPFSQDIRCNDSHQLFPPTVSFPITSSTSKKRKAEDEEPQPEDRMSASPSNSPHLSSHHLPAQPTHRHSPKRARADVIGRPLALPRLLETLDTESLRNVLQSICTRHPSIGTEVETTAPKPTVSSALSVLKIYESALQSSFPFGDDTASDYAYNRVRQALMNLLDALADFTPHFLPPNETQASQSLGFLDGATELIHRLPEWSSYQNNLHKQNAYEEISQAWTLAIREAAKRAGGIQLQYGGWDQKIIKHNQQARGKLQGTVDELKANIGWMAGDQPASPHQRSNQLVSDDDIASVRQELLSGTYGANYTVRVGPW